MIGALLARGPRSHPDALALLLGAAAALVQLAPGAAEGMSQPDGALLPEGASQREARRESSDEGCRGVAMTGAQALSRIGVAEPVCDTMSLLIRGNGTLIHESNALQDSERRSGALAEKFL